MKPLQLLTYYDVGTYIASGSHYEVGKSLHTDTFFYAKRFFQNATNSENIADILFLSLTDDNELIDNLTIVGMAGYLSVCLNKVVETIKKETPYRNVNYALVERDSEGFTFSYSDEILQNIMVVVPLTRTFERFFRLKDFLERHFPKSLVKSTVHSIFTVFHPELFYKIQEMSEQSELVIDNLKDEMVKQMYKTYSWISITKKNVFFKITDKKTGNLKSYKAKYLDAYPAEVFLSEKCPYCFPEIFGVGPLRMKNNERVLIQTNANHDSLVTVFGLPKFAEVGFTDDNVRNDIWTSNVSFDSVFQKVSKDPIHLYGHLKLDNLSFLNFIRREIFYRNNKANILDFFYDRLVYYRKELRKKNIIVITPGHSRTSGFLEDLLRRGTFGDNTVTIIPYQPHKEYLENFVHTYYPLVKSGARFIYFDDVIAGGTSFKLISDYLKNTRNDVTKNDVLDTGFDLVITLVDRTSAYNKEEIKRKLATYENPRALNSFLAYFKLNVPQIDSSHISNPIKERHEILSQIFKVSHLDALKIYAGKEIIKGSPKKLNTILLTYKNEVDLRYFPFIKNVEVYNFYKDRYTFEQRNLLKLRIFHEISCWLQDNCEDQFNDNDLVKLLADLSHANKRDNYFLFKKDNQPQSSRIPNIEINIVEETILKILSRSPFKDYQVIHDSVLRYNNKKLFESLEQIYNKQKNKHYNKDIFTSNGLPITFEVFRKFKTHIKRSIELNSNTLLSPYFLTRMKDVFIDDSRILNHYDIAVQKLDSSQPLDQRKILNIQYQKIQVTGFKYFLLHCYKELVFKNPTRSIILEELLNSETLQPIGIKDGKVDDNSLLKEVIADSYYQLRRILKSENIYLINELKDLLIDNNEFINNIIREDHSLDDVLISGIVENIGLVNHLLRHNNILQSKLFISELEQDFAFKEALNLITNRFYTKPRLMIVYGKELLVKFWLYYKYFKPPTLENDIARQARTLLIGSDPKGHISFFNESISSVLSMLYTVSLIHNTKGRRSPKRIDRSDDDSFGFEVKKILSAATNIIGEELDYAFFIEYRERENLEDVNTDNIFTVVSNEPIENRNIKLHREGLIYNMLYGLQDHHKGNLQTFIAVAKAEDGTILSLKEEYYRLKTTGADPEQINVEEALKLDYKMGETGLEIVKRSPMMLLFRFASFILNEESQINESQGQAVLVIFSSKEASTQNFYDFANIERMRLLLLIKEEMLGYLQKHFESDAFISVLEDRTIFELRDQLDHGVGNYKVALDGYYEEILDTLNNDDLDEENRKLIIIDYNLKINLIINAIIGQINAGRTIDTSIINVSSKEFEKRLKMILEDGYLGENTIHISSINVPTTFPESIHKYVFNIIIPEILINMKKYCPLFIDKNQGIEITYDQNRFIFKNRRRFPNTPFEIKAKGGIEMCKAIVKKLGLEDMKSHVSDCGNYFEVVLSLTKSKEIND